jgi:hypothetical protein
MSIKMRFGAMIFTLNITFCEKNYVRPELPSCG